jgi:hypothetical protein
MAGSPASIFDNADEDNTPHVPRPDPDQLRALSEAASFHSRESGVSSDPAPRRKPWRYRTGRNVQFNARAKQSTVDDFHAIAERLDRPIGEVLERALAALKRELAG